MSDGILNRAFYSAGDRSFTFLRVQDVEPILDNNKRLQGESQKSDWGRHIASIPNILLEKWLHEELDRGRVGLRIGTKEFDEIIRRKLADPDYSFLRTDAKHMAGAVGFGS